MNAMLPPPSATRTAFVTTPSALTTVFASRDTRLQTARGAKVRDTLTQLKKQNRTKNKTKQKPIIIKDMTLMIIIILVITMKFQVIT